MSPVTSALIGRRDETELLRQALESVEHGRPYAVALVGEPGIGKSRLLSELADDAQGHGLSVASGRASELERDLTFALLADALDRFVAGPAREAVGDLETDEQRELARMLPAVGRVAGVEAPPASGERHRAARALRRLLQSIAGRQPIALLLDDIQWADPASAEVLALLLHRPPDGGVLLAIASRPSAGAVHGALSAAARDGWADVIELTPLAQELMTDFLPGVGPRTRERLYRESGGNPFYLQELARALGSRPREGRQAHLAGVPRAVRTALAAELAGLAPETRATLQGAAVVGDPFELALAAAAAGVDEDTVALVALDELLAAELVRPAGAARHFRFRHPLVRRAVYEEAGGGWRLAAHARAAAVLEARGTSPAGRAHHVERAARPGDLEAVELLTAAGHEVAATAPVTAAGWLEGALRLLPEGAEHEPQRLALLGAQGRAFASAGRPGDARDALRRLLALLPVEAAAERVVVVEALADIEGLWLRDYDEARRLVDAERALPGASAPRLSAVLSLALVRTVMAQEGHAAAERLAAQARAGGREAGDRILEATAAVLQADASHCALRGDDPAALARVDRTIDEAQALVEALTDDEAAKRLQMMFWLGVARWFTGSLVAARAIAERGLALARGTGQGLLAPSFLALMAGTDIEAGRLDAAEAALEESLEAALISGNEHLEYWTSITSAWVALARGDVEEALAAGERGGRLSGTAPWSQAGWTVAEARLALGDPEGALASLDAYGRVNPGLWTLDRMRAADVLVRVLVALDRLEEASDVAERIPAEGGGRRAGIFGGIIARAQAVVLMASGNAAGAAELALAGCTVADEGAAALWAGRCRTLAGEALAEAGHVGNARAELRRAAAQLEEQGAWGYRDAALRQLRRLGDRPRRPAAAAPGTVGALSALTVREREVATLVAEGYTNAQIAARLHLSERTVEKHVSRVLGKLGMSSRTGVVRLLATDASSGPGG